MSRIASLPGYHYAADSPFDELDGLRFSLRHGKLPGPQPSNASPQSPLMIVPRYVR